MNSDSLNLLLKNISSKVTLSESDMEKIVPFFKSKTIKNKKDLLRHGDVCKELAFVRSGALRSYSVDEKGIEHVLQILLITKRFYQKTFSHASFLEKDVF